MPSQLNQGKIPAVELEPIIELENGYGRHLAFGRDHHRWASAQSGLFHIWQDLELKNTIVLQGLSTDGLHFSPNGQLLFISPYLFDLANNQLVDLPPLSGSLIAGIDPHQGA